MKIPEKEFNKFVEKLKDMRDLYLYKGYFDAERFINKIDNLTKELKSGEFK